MHHNVTTGVHPSTQQPRGAGSGGELWVEKHKPKHSRELVGNNTLIATLRQWLETWCASTMCPVQMGHFICEGHMLNVDQRPALGRLTVQSRNALTGQGAADATVFPVQSVWQPILLRCCCPQGAGAHPGGGASGGQVQGA
jgi:hypothetical protein